MCCPPEVENCTQLPWPCRHCQRLLSWSYGPSQSLGCGAGSVSSVRHTPFVLGPSGPKSVGLDHGVFPAPPLRRNSRLELYPLSGLRLLQSLTGPLRHPPRNSRSTSGGSSHGLCSPTTLQDWRIHSPGVCLTPYVALPGFLTLSAPYSPPDHPVLFHTGGVHGVHPSELLPLEEPCRLSTADALLLFTTHLACRWTRSLRAKRTFVRCSRRDPSHGLGLAPPY
jgi:hypothetical protein